MRISGLVSDAVEGGLGVPPTEFRPPRSGRLALDLGCGGNKKPGTLGVDVIAAEGVDIVCDLEYGALPLDADAVEYVYSSHCFEHLAQPSLLLREIPRVCADGAVFEFWLPYSWHGNAHVFGHKSYWNEEQFLGMSRHFRDIWRASTGVMWNLDELVYVVNPHAMQEVGRIGMNPAFAVRHLINVVSEFGVVGHLEKPGAAGSPPPPLKVSVGVSRLPEHRSPMPLPHWC
jgi:SAM-dependent methyltransferase